MKIKIDKADRAFSLYIRELANWKCQRCGGKFDRDEANSLQASHYFGRGNEATRFDPRNVVALCYACHVRWGSTEREEYRDWMIKQLGENGFKVLRVLAAGTKKKDRGWEYIRWKEAYVQLCKSKNLIPKKI